MTNEDKNTAHVLLKEIALKLEEVGLKLRSIRELTSEEDMSRYLAFNIDDSSYNLRRLRADIGETLDNLRSGEFDEADGDGDELEPVYAAQDARFEASSPTLRDDDGYDD